MPAARFGDLTAHNVPLGPDPGSPDVLIGGKPAWRAGQDQITCSMVNSAGAPHSTGSVLPTSTVLINDMPAARVGDTIMEAASDIGPNAITSGEPTVLIG